MPAPLIIAKTGKTELMLLHGLANNTDEPPAQRRRKSHDLLEPR